MMNLRFSRVCDRYRNCIIRRRATTVVLLETVYYSRRDNIVVQRAL